METLNSTRLEHELFISGHNGSSLLDIIITVLPIVPGSFIASTFTKGVKSGLWNFCIEYLFCIVPLILSFTVLNQVSLWLCGALMFFLLLRMMSYEVLNEQPTPIKIKKSIVTLSPESHLVLEYVEHLMKHYSNKKEKNSMNENDEPCLFEVKDEEILFDCLRSLCRFVEYPMWQHDLRAWKLISTILQTIQFALINCFSCSHCEMSRRKLRNMIKTLELWPTLFWRIPEDKSLWSLAEVVSYAAYTAFMFGYDKEIVNQVSALLDKGRYMKEKNMLMSAIMQDGWCLRDFNVFLSSLKHEWIEDYPTNACTSNKESNFEEMELLPLRRFNVTVNTNVNFNSGNVKGIPYLAPRLRKAKKRTLEEEPKESHIFEVNLEDSILRFYGLT